MTIVLDHEALGSLFFGRIEQVQINGEYRVVTVPLTKDTQLNSPVRQLRPTDNTPSTHSEEHPTSAKPMLCGKKR